MGRIAADRTDGDGGLDHVYVPGTEHLWRVVVEADSMALDTWRPLHSDSDIDRARRNASALPP